MTHRKKAIIFVHLGFDHYVPVALFQALQSNPETPIYFISDLKFKISSKIHQINIKDYSKSAGQFANIYKHQSPNNAKIELFCFQRWLIIEQFMTHNQIDEAWINDMDVMIYSSYNEVRPVNFENIGYFVLKDKNDEIIHASANSAFITLSGIQHLSKYLLNIYPFISDIANNNQYSLKLRSEEHSKSISDMTIFYLFALENKVINLFDEVLNGTLIVYNNAFITLNRVKLIGNKFIYEIYDKNDLKFYPSTNYQRFEIHNLHFVGTTKPLMHQYYIGTPIPMKWRILSKLILFIKRIKYGKR